MSTQPDRDQLQTEVRCRGYPHFLPQATVGMSICRLISADGSKGRMGACFAPSRGTAPLGRSGVAVVDIGEECRQLGFPST
jgi:hypothetical protein